MKLPSLHGVARQVLHALQITHASRSFTFCTHGAVRTSSIFLNKRSWTSTANPACGQQAASLVFTLALTRALQADLADRDFTAERHQVIVISTGAVDPIEQQRSLAERKETEDRHRHRWAGGCLPACLPVS